MNILAHYLAAHPSFGKSLMQADKGMEVIHALTFQGLLQVDLPWNLTGHPAIKSARIFEVDLDTWRQRWADLILDRGEVSLSEDVVRYGWTTAIEASESVFLLPQDDRSPSGDIQLFSKLGNISGRLRFSGRISDSMLRVQHTEFEANLHCAEGPCDSNSDCGDCCDNCECVGVSYRGIPGLKCQCETHGSV